MKFATKALILVSITKHKYHKQLLYVFGIRRQTAWFNIGDARTTQTVTYFTETSTKLYKVVLNELCTELFIYDSVH